MNEILQLKISFDGKNAEEHQLDLYDMSRAMMGLHRTLAIVTHLLLNKKLIKRSTSLRNAEILTFPSEKGSWEMTLAVIGLVGAPLVSSKDSLLGHLAWKCYDYVFTEAVGEKTNFNEDIGKFIQEHPSFKHLDQQKLDEVIFRCTNSLKDIHRPFHKSETANKATIKAFINGEEKHLSTDLTIDTFEYLDSEVYLDREVSVTGVIDTFTASSLTGKIIVPELDRKIPFKLSKDAKTSKNYSRILKSLESKLLKKDKDVKVTIVAEVIQTKKGKVKTYIVKKIWESD